MGRSYQQFAEEAKSKSQQRLMGMVRAAQKGEMDNPSEQVKKLAMTMKKKDVKDFASTKHDDLPEKKEVNEIAPAIAAGAALGIAAGGGVLIKKAIDAGKTLRKNAERRMGKEPVKESAWQRKEGKNKTGGLNEKGRKSYERENPGSDLKAPQPEGGPRKRSFCARMGGMKGPMKDEKGRPTRKALALRKWKC
jgi:hypothetical protein